MRILGVDYGEQRIGLAVSDATGLLARPWKAIPRRGNVWQVAKTLAAEVAALRGEDDGLGVVVIGLPRRLSGEKSGQTIAVEALTSRMRDLLDIPVVLQDERLSSREAESLLARKEKDWRRRKASLDAMSAAVILQGYLDSVGAARAAGASDAGEEPHA